MRSNKNLFVSITVITLVILFLYAMAGYNDTSPIPSSSSWAEQVWLLMPMSWFIGLIAIFFAFHYFSNLKTSIKIIISLIFVFIVTFGGIGTYLIGSSIGEKTKPARLEKLNVQKELDLKNDIVKKQQGFSLTKTPFDFVNLNEGVIIHNNKKFYFYNEKNGELKPVEALSGFNDVQISADRSLLEASSIVSSNVALYKDNQIAFFSNDGNKYLLKNNNIDYQILEGTFDKGDFIFVLECQDDKICDGYDGFVRVNFSNNKVTVTAPLNDDLEKKQINGTECIEFSSVSHTISQKSNCYKNHPQSHTLPLQESSLYSGLIASQLQMTLRYFGTFSLPNSSQILVEWGNNTDAELWIGNQNLSQPFKKIMNGSPVFSVM